jgi:peptidoglycan/xylan/chitin deacetylase (PgdA/CDA1 family)
MSVYARRSLDRMGNRSGKLILTFDDWDDNNPDIALTIGEYLKSEGIMGVFFPIGMKADRHPDVVPGLRAQGHYVGSHSYSHARLTTLEDDELVHEISDGVACNALRPPYSAWDARVYQRALDLGYTLKLWTISTGDWHEDENGFRSVELIRQAVKEAPEDRKANGVIIGHLQTNYPAAIPGIIDDMRAEGRSFYPNRGPVGADFPAEFV